MSDFEKAIRYLCFAKVEDDEARIFRYKEIERMIHDNTELIEKYAKKYERLLDLLDF